MKKAVSLLVLIFVSTIAFAKSINFFTPQMPEITVKSGLQMNILPDSKNSSVDLLSIATFDMKELFWDAGFRFNDENFDLTTQVIYWPTIGKKQNKNLGVGFTYHFYEYPHIFSENDIFLDLYYKCKVNQYFEFYTRYGLFIKATRIPSVADAMPWIKNTTMNFDFSLTFSPNQNWKIYTSLGSGTYFNYPIFFTPLFGCGFEYVIPEKKVSLGLDIMTTWYDGIIVSLNPGEISSTFFVKVRL